MFSTLKNIWRGLTQKGKIFPHQLAFTLLIPLRNFSLSPSQLISRLQLAPHHHILEVGCGSGYFSPMLAQAVPQGRLVLADIQPEMLAYAQKRLSKRNINNAEYYLCNGEVFNFADQSFDRIVLVTVFGEIANQAAYLNEFHRLLRPNGIVSISETVGDPDKLSCAELEQLMQQHQFALTESFGNERNYTLNFRAV